jgi:transcriptional regulator with XRE-family HTH domain
MERGLTLSEVSERAGIPVSTLSKVENGKTDLTMDRLLRISVALDVNIADLFRAPTRDRAPAERSRRSITRIGESAGVKSAYGEYFYHAQDLLDKRVVPIIAEIRAKSLAEFGDYHSHIGEEFLLVLDGELLFYTDTYAPVHLKKGESIYFDSNMGHAYVAAGKEPCRLLLICAPSEALRVMEETHARRDADLIAPRRSAKKRD